MVNILHFYTSTLQESPPAWTQEAYHPLCSEYSFCCPNWVPPRQGTHWPGGGRVPTWVPPTPAGYPLPLAGYPPDLAGGYPMWVPPTPAGYPLPLAGYPPWPGWEGVPYLGIPHPSRVPPSPWQGTSQQGTPLAGPGRVPPILTLPGVPYLGTPSRVPPAGYPWQGTPQQGTTPLAGPGRVPPQVSAPWNSG